MSLLPTIEQALTEARDSLRISSDSAQLDAEILLAFVLDKPRSYLRTWPEHELSAEQLAQLQALIQRRAQGEPVAYLTGERDFWDMRLKVTPATLIPRPETELLVEQALARIPADAHWQIADLGTGSGAIALAIARERPHCQIMATDISAEALAVAQENAARLNVANVAFHQGHWFAPLKGKQFEMLLSNPPYVHPDDPHLGRGDLRFEPPTALAASPDGLSDIRHIATEARRYLTNPGWLVLEHGYDQGEAVRALLTQLGYQQVQVIEDLQQNQRVTLGLWQRGQWQPPT